ncbi:peptidase M50 [Mycolicibacterium sp. BiH015]|uniref:peptidase M50 n=1 Tax=Mycolicibacterium sp. BiH015 TaxID=3018808 RepID=UPI0022E6DBE5|nr:peptidase M50 [Mycolicibacterium sp. BiH015]MDA2891559.1 peptidase M50 [Mycolicibacterium sp. BiH015]
MKTSELAVVRSGGRRIPRALSPLPVLDGASDGLTDYRRLVVVGSHRDLSVVLTRLLRADRLDIEVAHVQRPWQAGRACRGSASRVPLVRDETGTVITGAAYWLPPDGQRTIRGEAIVDDERLFDGEATAVRIEPIATMPGLRATVLSGRMRPKRWISGRAAQLGTTGALVVRDGEAAPRPARRSTFYRHTEGWLRV